MNRKIDGIRKYIVKYFYTDDKKIYPLLSVRFFLFIFIFVHHCYNLVEIPILRQPALAVSSFIILSGFLNGFIYINKDLSIKQSFDFVKKRIKKFYPLHFIMILIAIIISGVFNFSNIEQVQDFFKKLFCNLLLIQSWINKPDYYFSFNGVTWYLSTYLFLTFITIPILLLLKKINKTQRRNAYLILIAILLFGITVIIVNSISMNKLDDRFCEFWIYIFPPSRIFEYIIGMIFGIICYNNKISFKFEKVIFTFLEICTLIMLYMYICNVSKIPHIYNYINNRFNTWIIPVIIMIIVFSYHKGLISKILSMKVLVFLGEISMYMYMIHQPLINIFSKSVGHTVHYRYFALYILIITIIFSCIINKYEKNNNLIQKSVMKDKNRKCKAK